MIQPTTKLFNRDFWIAASLVIPSLSRVILPDTFERMLSVNILTIPLYLPNLFLLYFCYNALRNKGVRNFKIIFFIQAFFAFFGWAVNDYQNRFLFLFAGSFYFLAICIGLNFKLNEVQRIWVYRFSVFTLFFLSLEIVLFSLGIMSTFGSTEIVGQSYSDYFRVSTTAGAATGTAVIVYMLTTISIMLTSSRKWQYIILLVGFVSALLTVSRGTIASFILYLTLWFFLINKQKHSRFKILLSALIGVFVIFKLGLFNPLIERTEIVNGNDFTSGRNELQASSLKYYHSDGSTLFGLGTSNVHSSYEVQFLAKSLSTYAGAPHNCYVLVLCEQGILGVGLFFLFWLLVLWYCRKNFAIVLALIPLLLGCFNTEAIIIVDSMYSFLLTIYLILILDKKRWISLHYIGS